MRLSTGVILSILSANVFAIEHLNDVHSGSLLARRAVMADADGPFLQKRNNNEDQKKQAKPKTFSNPNSPQAENAYTPVVSEDDPDSNPNPSPDTGKGPTDSHAYGPNQSDADKNERGNAYTGIDPSQEGASFVNFPRESSSQVLDRMRHSVSRVKTGVGLLYSRRRASVSSKEVAFELDGKEGMVMGKKGKKIGKELYALFLLALETSQSYKTLYLDPVNSPFVLELPTSTPSGSKQRYKRLQKDVQQSIKNHILDIKYAIRYITREPENVILELEKLLKKTDNFTCLFLV
ncbi:hypothetical protein BASA83_007011 [Batrachochytrium salamandrivorans]|nr:hypothetical protein BASA83_007011 [Batrachochytrium salamandrivorans]